MAKWCCDLTATSLEWRRMLGQLSPNGLVLSSAGMLASAPFSGPRHSMVCCGENTEMEVDIAMKLRGAMIPQECQEKNNKVINHIHLVVIAFTSIPVLSVFSWPKLSSLERLDLSFGSTDVFVLHLQLLRGSAGAGKGMNIPEKQGGNCGKWRPS